MGFGTEILFMIVLGVLLLGPKRLHTVLGHVARAKSQIEKASRNLLAPPVQLRGVVGHGEEDPKQPAVGDLRRVVGDPHRFCVAGFARADHFILRRSRFPSRVSRGRADYALYMLEHSLDAPKASSRNYSSLLARRRRLRGICSRLRNGD